jgi:hypothetical protein
VIVAPVTQRAIRVHTCSHRKTPVGSTIEAVSTTVPKQLTRYQLSFDDGAGATTLSTFFVNTSGDTESYLSLHGTLWVGKKEAGRRRAGAYLFGARLQRWLPHRRRGGDGLLLAESRAAPAAPAQIVLRFPAAIGHPARRQHNYRLQGD